MAKASDIVGTVQGLGDTLTQITGQWNDAVKVATEPKGEKSGGSAPKGKDASDDKSKGQSTIEASEGRSSVDKTKGDKKPEKDKPMSESERKDESARVC